MLFSIPVRLRNYKETFPEEKSCCVMNEYRWMGENLKLIAQRSLDL